MQHLYIPINKEELAPVQEKKADVKTNKKKYDQKKYNDKFIEKNKDKVMEKKVCDICCGSYTYYNKSKHMSSAKHIKLVNKHNNNGNSN